MRGKQGSRRPTSESQTSTYEYRQPPSSANNSHRSRRREHETLAVAQAPRPRAPRRANFDELPNPDIGNQQPELSTTFTYLPDATGIYFNAAYFFYCRSTNILGDPRLQPRLSRIPEWSEFQDLHLIEERGPPGFQQWLHDHVFAAIPRRWAHFTNLSIPAYIYQRNGIPAGAVFFAQDHSAGYEEVGFYDVVIIQLVISFTELTIPS